MLLKRHIPDNLSKTIDLVTQIINYIDVHYSENITVNSIVEHFNHSYGYIARIFKNRLNITIKTYLKNKRIESSLNDIIHTNYSITEIAYNIGFPNTKAFITDFKSLYYQPPKEYRIKVKK